MKAVKLSVLAAVFMCAAVIYVLPVAAGTNLNCTFNSQLDAENYNYNITATPDDSCKRQVLRVSVLKDGNPFAQLITPYEAIVEKAWIVDLDDDGKYELIVISHDPANESKKSMELFAIDGSSLKPVRFPAPPDMTGYRGGDRYTREGVRLIRVFPVYLPRDVNGAPTGGERKIVYQYRNKEMLIGSASDVAKQVAAVKKNPKLTAGTIRKSSVVKITGIKTQAEYIEIQADGPIERYKISRIDDPWRLIVDIAGAGLGLQENKIVVNKHGVSTARIGKNKGVVRIVFDSTLSPMPVETVTPVENALRIGFYLKVAE